MLPEAESSEPVFPVMANPPTVIRAGQGSAHAALTVINANSDIAITVQVLIESARIITTRG